MRRAALTLAVAGISLVLGLAVEGGLGRVAAASRRRAMAVNDRLHRWLVGSGAMRCERCGPPRPFDAWRLLRGP